MISRIQLPIMSRLAVVCVLTMLAGYASVSLAQEATVDTLGVSLGFFDIGDDLLRAELSVISDADTLDVPVKAFQFEWSITSNMEYVGLQNDRGLAAVSGWTVAVNPDKGRVGGFSSSADALAVPGTLLVMDLQWLKDDAPAELCLVGIRLNSDNPVAEPASICRVIKR